MSTNDPFSVASHLELLEGIDRGDWQKAFDYVNSAPATPTGVFDTLIRIEMAIYLDDHDTVQNLLSGLSGSDLWLDDSGDSGRIARRLRLLMVEDACFIGNLDEADRLVRPLVESARFVEDRQSELRAYYDMARIARHRANWMLAIERLEQARELAREIGNICYEGRIAYTLGYCWYSQNRLDRAEPLLQSALDLLRRSENLRYRATVETFYGCILCDQGELKAALDLLQFAEETVARLNIIGDMIMARMNTARTLLSLGRFEEAERLLMEILIWERRPEHTPMELITLRLLAISQCVRGRATDALRSAIEAQQLASIKGNDLDRFEARLLVSRSKALLNDPVAANELEALVVEADSDGTPYQQAEARIYLAQALLSSDPTRANALLKDVRTRQVVSDFYWLQCEIELLNGVSSHVPVRVDDEDRLVMDARSGWADLKSAREATELYWFKRALDETDGNISAASRLLGLTRNEGYYLHRLVIVGEPARPSRRKGSGAPAQPERRRRGSRS